MHGSYRIGRVKGIPIKIHISFLLVLPLFAYIFGSVFRQAARLAGVPQSGLSAGPWLWGLVLALALFAAVLVHELAHSLYAVRRGGEVREITLLMLGGVSQLTKMPDGPRREALMAFVGPLTSLVIGGLCLGAYFLFGGLGSFNASFALFYLGYLNIFLGVFNLLPAFPMDGGRILRAGLTGWLGRVQATRVAAAIGKAFALLLGLLGLFTLNFFVLIVAMFVYAGAQAEAQDVILHDVLEKVRVGEVMTRHAPAIAAQTSLAEAAEAMAAARTTALVVVDGEQVLGILSIFAIERVPAARRPGVSAREAMAATESVMEEEDASKAARLMTEQALPFVPVVGEGGLVGVLTREDLARAIRLRALADAQARRERPRHAQRLRHGEQRP